MIIIDRLKSEVLLLNKKDELWLTRRVKHKKDSKRRKITNKGWSVRHIPIERIPQNGDWLFTCSIEPKQFDKWLEEDDFITIDGSVHDKKHCSLKLISTEYAEFFIKHKLWELYEINFSNFELYEKAVK